MKNDTRQVLPGEPPYFISVSSWCHGLLGSADVAENDQVLCEGLKHPECDCLKHSEFELGCFRHHLLIPGRIEDELHIGLCDAG